MLADLGAGGTPRPSGGVEDLVRWKRRELLRIAARDLTGRDGLEQVGWALAQMADDVWAGACARSPVSTTAWR